MSSDSGSNAVEVLKHEKQEKIALGEDSPKRTLAWVDLAAAAVSAIVCALAVAVVTVDSIAWHLGYNNQIIVVGLLVGIMSICLKTIVSTMFLMCEVTFGNSTIQNIDAIKTNSSLATHVDWWWRSALVLLIALPLAISVAYKRFPGGSATIGVGSSWSLYNQSFGMHPPPGLLPLGWNTGISLMFNATMPFLIHSTNQAATNDQEYNDTEVPLPSFPRAFGYNTLVIDENTTALLDAPHAKWIERVQTTLDEAEVFEIGANVLAVVSRYDPAVEAHRTASPDSWWTSDDFEKYNDLIFEISVPMITAPDSSLYSLWLRYSPPSDFDPRAAATFLSMYKKDDLPGVNASLIATARKECYGRWNITKTTANLMDESNCNNETAQGDLIQDTSHLVLTNFTGLALTRFYPPTLTEMIGPFLFKQETSPWFRTTMATAVASMYWSRIAASIGPSSVHFHENDSFRDGPAGNQWVVENATLSYQSHPQVTWSKPTMRKSAWLFVVIAVQPAIVLIILVCIIVMYKVPVGKGFGMIAILAGVETKSLGLLGGAEVSGELRQPVYLGASQDSAEGRKLGYFLSERRVPDGERLK